MAVTNIEIEITLDPVTNQYVATVDILNAPAKRAGFVRWHIKRMDGFPAAATVIIQFVNQSTPPKVPTDGPFIDGSMTHGRYPTQGNFIYGLVGLLASGKFPYTISWDDGGTEKLLLDPEIVVDGNLIILTKFIKGLTTALQALKKADKARGKTPKKAAAKKAKAKKAKTKKAKKR
jgi:hypothetical protein